MMKTLPDGLDLIAKSVTLYRNLVEKTKKEGKSVSLARTLISVRDYMEHLDALAKQVREIRDELAYTLVPEAFERDGVTTHTLEEGYRVTISPFVRASTRDMQQGIEWMKKHNLGAIVKETINASTLAALAKDWIGQGKELPDEIFNIHVGFNTSVTKVQK